MDGKEHIFLSMAEAVFAIRTDFYQYPPQTRLFLELCPLLLGPETTVAEDSRNSGLWISTPGRRHKKRPKPVTARDLGRLLIDALETKPPPARVMAQICTKIFQTRAVVQENNPEAEKCIRIDTGMEEFDCRQCGRCCRVLDYRHELSAADYRHWQILGRNDILERVGTILRNGKIVSYAAWMEPGTRRFIKTCPWLAPATPGRWICRIHDVKPAICRQYPGTRKHGLMTGCAGFGD